MNPTGIKPVEYKVLILQDEVEDKSSGGIWLADTTRDRQTEAQDRGTIVEVGGMAFSDWRGIKPKVGDKVLYDRYAGSAIRFRDKENKMSVYRLCEDKKVGAVLEEENE